MDVEGMLPDRKPGDLLSSAAVHAGALSAAYCQPYKFGFLSYLLYCVKSLLISPEVDRLFISQEERSYGRMGKPV